jgi:hypothetical protein
MKAGCAARGRRGIYECASCFLWELSEGIIRTLASAGIRAAQWRHARQDEHGWKRAGERFSCGFGPGPAGLFPRDLIQIKDEILSVTQNQTK